MPESRVFDLYVFGASPQQEGLPSSPPRPFDTGVTVLCECGCGIVIVGDYLSMFVQPSLQPSTHSSLHHPGFLDGHGWARNIPTPQSLCPLQLTVAPRFHSTTFSAGGELDPRSGHKIADFFWEASQPLKILGQGSPHSSQAVSRGLAKSRHHAHAALPSAACRM